MPETEWKTAITRIEPNKVQLRGYKIEDLMENTSFVDVIYLTITGNMPDPKASKLLNAILVSSIDHGVTPPSTISALTAASTGASFNAALAAGILSINKHHGGAIEDCMETISEAVELKKETGDTKTAAEKIVTVYRNKKKKLAGLGHRLHKKDPRTAKILELSKESGMFGQFAEMAVEIEKALKISLGKELPLNVDGAIAALLLELKIPKDIGNMFFVMARTPGLIAHIYEEKMRQKPMRKIIPGQYEYDGKTDLKLKLAERKERL